MEQITIVDFSVLVCAFLIAHWIWAFLKLIYSSLFWASHDTMSVARNLKKGLSIGVIVKGLISQFSHTFLRTFLDQLSGFKRTK